MADIEKVMSVEDADVEKFMGVARADIEKIMGVEMPSLAVAWLGARAVIGGGWTGSSPSTDIDYWTISADSTSSDGGDLTVARQCRSGASNKTVGLWMGGYDSDGYSNIVDKISSISSMGGAASFGTLSEDVNGTQVTTNGTKGLRMGGRTSSSGTGGTDTCDIYTIADSSSVSATDHGNLGQQPYRIGASISGSTRGITAGGTSSSQHDVIQYKLFASTDDSTDYGNLTEAMESSVGAEDSSRGVVMGGYDTSPARSNVVQYFSVDGESGGFTATDAMNLAAGDNQGAGVSDNTYASFAAGTSDHDGVQRITIQSLSGTASTDHALTNTGRYVAGGFSGNA